MWYLFFLFTNRPVSLDTTLSRRSATMLRFVTLLYTDLLNLAALAWLSFSSLRFVLRSVLLYTPFNLLTMPSPRSAIILRLTLTQYRVLLPYHAFLLPLRPNHSASPLPCSTSPLRLSFYTASSYLFATIVLPRCSSSLYIQRQVVSPVAWFVLCFALHRTPNRCFATISFRGNS